MPTIILIICLICRVNRKIIASKYNTYKHQFRILNACHYMSIYEDVAVGICCNYCYNFFMLILSYSLNIRAFDMQFLTMLELTLCLGIGSVILTLAWISRSSTLFPMVNSRIRSILFLNYVIHEQSDTPHIALYAIMRIFFKY